MDRKEIYSNLREEMENAGFKLKGVQRPFGQRRKEDEFVFMHPILLEKFKDDGYKVNSTLFYIKPLSDEPNCEIGLVAGKTSPLNAPGIFNKPNFIDTHKNYPAWINKDGDNALDHLLFLVKKYLGIKGKGSDEENAINILLNPKNSGQAFLRDTEKRKVIELHAMDFATEYYVRKGFDVIDTSANNPYDLKCENKKEGKLRYIEVKGTTTDGSHVFLTKNEVNFARTNSKNCVLFIVKNIALDIADNKWVAEGGESQIIDNWCPVEENLTPLSFKYSIGN